MRLVSIRVLITCEIDVGLTLKNLVTLCRAVRLRVIRHEMTSGRFPVSLSSVLQGSSSVPRVRNVCRSVTRTLMREHFLFIVSPPLLT